MNKLLLAALAAFVVLATCTPPASAGGHVIVKYRKGGKRRASVRAVGDARVVGRVRGQGTSVLAVDGDPAAAAARIDAAPGVAWAEPDQPMHALDAPDDPLLAQLGGLGLMNIQAGWDAAGLSGSFPRDGGVPVAIVDTGI